MNFNIEDFEAETLRRANAGEVDAAREALRIVRRKLDTEAPRDPVIEYLLSNLSSYLDEGIPLDKALGLERQPRKTGRKPKIDPLELGSADIILRQYCGYSPETACMWLEKTTGADRRTVQRNRKTYDASYANRDTGPLSESLDLELLLYNAGSLRKNVASVLPQI